MPSQLKTTSQKIVTAILMTILVASFALWGVADMFGGGGKNPTVLKVGNQKISWAQYQRNLSVEHDNIRKSLGSNYSPELLKQLKFEQYVLQNLLQKSLLAQEAASIGLEPDDMVIAKNIHQNPAFAGENGTFDKKRFEAILRAQSMSEKIYIEQLRGEIAAAQMLDALAIRPPYSQNALNVLLAVDQETRNITLYRASKAAAGAIPQATDEDLQNLLKQEAASFTLPEYRAVSYVAFPEREFEARANALEDAIAGGSTLKEAATTLSLTIKPAGTFSREGKSPSGELEKNLPMLDKFIDTAFATDEASESSLISSKGTYYMLRVEKITPEKLRPFAEIKGELQATWNAMKQQEMMVGKMQKLDAAVNQNRKNASIINEFSLQPIGTDTITRTSKIAGGTALPPALHSAIYQLKTGEFTAPFAEPNGDFLIARLDAATLGNAATHPKEKVEAFKKALGDTKENEIMGEYLRYLQTKHPVWLNEAVLNAKEAKP